MAAPGETLTTLYVYDLLGRLRAVLQPQYQAQPSAADFAFLYRYDHRHRLTVRKVPGADSTLPVYDGFDRLVLSQDGNQRSRSVWAFVKYDALNRPVLTGELPSNQTRAGWQALADQSTAHHEQPDGSAAGYTLTQTLPTVTEANLLTVAYYDDYTFPQPAGLAYVSGYYPAAHASVKSLPTGQRVRMLTASGSLGAWLASVTYYDGEYRPLQYARQLPGLGATATERTSLRYRHDLAATVDEQTTEQQTDSGTRTLRQNTAHDHADRPLSVTEALTTPTQSLAATTAAHRYDELGQMAQKWLHSPDGTYFRRRTDHTYHLRSWLTDARTHYKKQRLGPDLPFFAYQLAYDNGPTYTNGNISVTEWRGKDESSFTKGLGFAYDGANRLTGSSGLHGYGDTESGITFDKNGNITMLTRAGAAVDQLTYSYAGNRLSTLSDASGNDSGVKGGSSIYDYDANGNMTDDGNRSATLTYNHLNLPKSVTLGGKTFTYDYDALGTKHRYMADTFTVKYEGPFEYDQANALQRVAISEGQITFGDTARYSYYIKDHLGNVRVVFDAKGRVLQKSDYYPFGLSISRDSLPLGARIAANRYNFLGKETQIETGYIDLQARFYDPAIGRFLAVDPVTEGQLEFSPYHYSFNNPIRFSDPDGRFPECCGGLVDFVTGVGQALSDDIVGGTSISATPGYVDAYNNGRTVGHYAAMVVGATEVAVGIIGAAAAAVGEIGSVGLATPVAVPVAAVSTAAIVHGTATGARAAENLRDDKGRVNASSGGNSGRGSNHQKPDPQAQGDHSTFRTDPQTGKTTNTATYKQNPRNPAGFQETKRVDITGVSHTNSKTGQEIKTPHVHEPKQKDPRPAKPDELPRQ